MSLSKGSYFLTVKTAQMAVELVKPTIERCMQEQPGIGGPFFKRRQLAIVILNPTVLYSPSMENHIGETVAPILHSECIGYEDKRENPYYQIALSKATISWRTGMPSREVALFAPHLLRKGDTPYYGGVVRDGLIVAASGVQSYFDEMVAGYVADTCIGLSHFMMHPIQEAKQVNFLGEEL